MLKRKLFSMNEKKLDLKLGYTCNNNCMHCIVGDKRTLGDKTTQQVFIDLENGIRDGCNLLVITGGEPTIRKDFFQIVSYAKQLNYKMIQLQTNGRMFFSKQFTKRTMDAGLDQVVPAIHAHKPKIHDRITRADNSWKQTVEGIKNLREYDIHIYANTVVSKMNYKILPELARFLAKLKVDQMQFAFLHPAGNVAEYFKIMVPNVSVVAPYIHKSIAIAQSADVWSTVEGIPFCLMKGLEKHVSEQYIPTKSEVIDIDRTITDYYKLLKNKSRVKGPKCVICKFFDCCIGPWREYTNIKGFKEFKPVK